MKKIMLVACAVASGAAAASAADLAPRYTKAPAPMMADPVYNWTGFYIGGNAGYGWGKADTSYNPPGGPNGVVAGDIPSISFAGSPHFKPEAAIAGGQIGYNYQFARTWVVGIEADFQSFKFGKSFDGRFQTPSGDEQDTHTDVSANWLFTSRGRLGYVANHWLIYGTGGLALERIKFGQVNVMPDYPFVDTFSVSKNKVGWTAGAGAEYAFLNNWSVKAEYLYVDIGNVGGTSTTGVLNPPSQVSFGHNVDFRVQTVRGGLNYKLN